MTLVDDIKTRIDIVDLVGETVSLRRSGRTFKALCPYHTERTPSFIVDPSRQTWHCFGACDEGGDIFSWVMKQENVEFRQALALLAERAGLRLTPLDARAEEQNKRLDRLRSANEAAATFYRSALQGGQAAAADARRYLEQRGLSAEIGEAFGLGYAPDERDALQGYLSARGFSAKELEAAGLTLDGEHGTVDRFRGRLIFPIRDSRGRCVGFGGRVLSGAGAKYLNTPQTELFDKSGLLYGLDRSRDAVRQADHVVIVEGYMDVIAAHQHGQMNVVASMGTALTPRQVALLKPLTRRLLLALDADAAGAAATLRGIETTRDAVGTEKVPVLDARGLVRLQDELAADIRIIELPTGRDPDDLIRLDPDRWAALVRDAPGYLDYRFARAKREHNLSDPRQRAAVADDLLPLVTAIAQPVVRAEYLERLAGLARVDVRTLRSRVGRAGPRPSRAAREIEGDARREGPKATIDPKIQHLLKLLILRPEVVPHVDTDAAALIEDSVARELLEIRLASALEEKWLDQLPDPLRAVADRLAETADDVRWYSTDEAIDAVRQTIARLRADRRKQALRSLQHTIAEHEREYDKDDLARTAAALSEPESPSLDAEIAGAARSILDSQAKSRELHAPEPQLREKSADADGEATQ